MPGTDLSAPILATTDRSEVAEVAEHIRVLARDIGKNVDRILVALQTGDITQQRVQHVQSGLARIPGPDRSANPLGLKAAAELLLSAQLEAALQDYERDLSKLLPGIEGLAADSLALVSLSDAVKALRENGHDVGDLQLRIDVAIRLFDEIQATDGAARFLAGRLATQKAAVVSKTTSDLYLLDQRAAQLMDRIGYMGAAAEDCVVILQQLKEVAEALISDRPVQIKTSNLTPQPQNGLEVAARIKAIRDKAETDMAPYTGHYTDILRRLTEAGVAATAPGADKDLETEGYVGLKFAGLDLGPNVAAFKQDLIALLADMERMYSMAAERDVHRAFVKACRLQVAARADAIEDGLL